MISKNKLSSEEARLYLTLNRIKAVADQPYPKINFYFHSLNADCHDLRAWTPVAPVKPFITLMKLAGDTFE